VHLEIDATLEEINARINAIPPGGAVERHDHALPRFRLAMPVLSLRCGNRLMDKDVYRSLRASEHPAIVFELASLPGAVKHEVVGDSYRTAVNGDITVGGTRRRITFDVEGWRLGHDAFYLRARVPMRMTDFGVRPPTALFGLIRARDEIKAYFELRVRARPSVAK
jgi:polyisoprenoid-binding protein YceI